MKFEIICPNCKKTYLPILERKTNDLIQIEHPKATAEQREQLISGLCSNKCWSEYLGVTDGENEKNGSIRATEINEKDKVDINTPPIKTDLPTINYFDEEMRKRKLGIYDDCLYCGEENILLDCKCKKCYNAEMNSKVFKARIFENTERNSEAKKC